MVVADLQQSAAVNAQQHRAKLVHQRLLLVRGGRSPAVFSDRQACHSLEIKVGAYCLVNHFLQVITVALAESQIGTGAIEHFGRQRLHEGIRRQFRARERIGRFGRVSCQDRRGCQGAGHR